MPKLPKISSLGAINFYVFIKWPKCGPLLHPCLHLLNFGTFPHYCERSKLYINPPPTNCKNIKQCNFYFLHNQWLELALINARKNVLLISRFPMFPWIQIHNHQLQSALIYTRKNVLLICRKIIDLAWIICSLASNIKQI